MKEHGQEAQVIEVMRKEGGFATFKRLHEILDFSSWKSKTPEASVCRIVQNSKEIFRIQPGLWALEAMRDEVLKRFNLKQGGQEKRRNVLARLLSGFAHRDRQVSAHDYLCSCARQRPPFPWAEA